MSVYLRIDLNNGSCDKSGGGTGVVNVVLVLNLQIGARPHPCHNLLVLSIHIHTSVARTLRSTPPYRVKQ